MKVFAAGIDAAYSANVSTLATCVKILRTDSTVYTYTTHDASILYGGETYLPSFAYNPSSVATSNTLAPSNMDILGVLDDEAIKEEDVLKGLFADAEVWFFVLDYTNPTGGIDKLLYGKLGEFTLKGEQFVAEFRTITQQLSQNIGELYSRTCRANFGDSRCGVIVIPSTWSSSTAYNVGDKVKATTYTGRVFTCTIAGTSNDTEGEPTWNTTVGGTTIETDGVEWYTEDALYKQSTVGATPGSRVAFTYNTGDIPEATGWYDNGTIEWTSGNNTGIKTDIKYQNNSTATITMYVPLPYDITVGDTFTIITGCNHKLLGSDGTLATGDCKTKFNNAVNFRGEPYIPTEDELSAN